MKNLTYLGKIGDNEMYQESDDMPYSLDKLSKGVGQTYTLTATEVVEMMHGTKLEIDLDSNETRSIPFGKVA